MRLLHGNKAPDFQREDIFGNLIRLEDYVGKKVLLSFYRFSACPFCNMRVHKLMGYADAYEKKGLHMISFWQSPKDSILEHVGQKNPPFPMIPDPAKEVYTLYGVENSWGGALKLMTRQPSLAAQAMREGVNPKHIDGELNLIPADFLIRPDGSIHRAYYGEHIGDHIPFDEIEKFLGFNSTL